MKNTMPELVSKDPGPFKQETRPATAPPAPRGGAGSPPATQQALRGGGTLELLPEGYGFLRRAERNYLSSPEDVYVSPAQVRRLSLRTRMTVQGVVRPPREEEGTWALLQVEAVNGGAPEPAEGRPRLRTSPPSTPPPGWPWKPGRTT
jgi:transcription termination factor Rho